MKSILFKEARIINRGEIIEGDLLVRGDRIEKTGSSLTVPGEAEEIRVDGAYLMPGIIDDQVHFREPGLEHKANIFTESRAAVAGGVTSFMEMPNTKPPAVTQELLEDKYRIGARSAWANYSFFMGATNDNIEEVLRTDPKKVCGIKVFMGSSTGNMLVDNTEALEKLFSQCPMLIATHCEDEATVRSNFKIYEERYGKLIPPSAHPLIRSREACMLSSGKAVTLAKKYNTRLHVLHITTKEEPLLFEVGEPDQKRITAEACVHHMYFSDRDYLTLGNQIKCNPAIKTEQDRDAVLQAVLDNRIDIIATDHAPHTWDEKMAPYAGSPSGLPLIQHTLLLMLVHWREGKISLERIVEKMCHAPARCFHVAERGFLDEGYYADIVTFDAGASTIVSKENVLYKCGWSPLDGRTLPGKVLGTWVNGQRKYDNGLILGEPQGKRLTFTGVN